MSYLLAIILCLPLLSAYGQTTLADTTLSNVNSLDALLEQAKASYERSTQLNQTREQRFLEAKKNQIQLLKTAKKTLKKLEKNSTKLKATFNKNETKTQNLKADLKQKSGTLGELFGVVRQMADDASGIVHTSLISAQLPNRETLINELAQSKALPSIQALEQLWVTLLEEMTQSAKITQFKAPLINAEGTEMQATITRIGVFNAFHQGRYLKYLPESQRLVELARQPASRYQAMAHTFENATTDIHPVGLDPSRGAILAALVQTPSLLERVKQGGIIAYIILAVGAFAVLLILERFIVLNWTHLKIKRQLKQPQPNLNNPLGRIFNTQTQNPQQTVATLQLKLDEAILKELPALQRGLSTIAILAAIAPLLGLLGTVTGMIETFQSITLFGTGDPKYMSSGISQALVTTELGLIVAIPIIILHSLLTGRGNRLIQVLDEQSAGLIATRAQNTHEPITTH